MVWDDTIISLPRDMELDGSPNVNITPQCEGEIFTGFAAELVALSRASNYD